jgi:hypothetical protein
MARMMTSEPPAYSPDQSPPPPTARPSRLWYLLQPRASQPVPTTTETPQPLEVPASRPRVASVTISSGQVNPNGLDRIQMILPFTGPVEAADTHACSGNITDSQHGLSQSFVDRFSYHAGQACITDPLSIARSATAKIGHTPILVRDQGMGFGTADTHTEKISYHAHFPLKR